MSALQSQIAGMDDPAAIQAAVDSFVNDLRSSSDQLAAAVEKRGAGDLAQLLHSGETWAIS